MSLGFVASGKRSIGSGAEYNKYFTDKAEGSEVELLSNGTVYDTLTLMKKVVSQTLSQTVAISKALKGATREATCRNIWNFLYHNVQYKKDNPLREQLRTPIRSWKDRKSGVDCDCYSIFSSSILTNLKIPHGFRMAGYKGDFQHVYVVVPKEDKSGFYIIDPVVDRFNYEAPYAKKHDQMTKVSMLNGVGVCNTKPEILRYRKFVDTQQIVDKGLIPTRDFLIRSGIAFEPSFDTQLESSVYLINTPTGVQKIPTVLTVAQTEQLLSSMISPGQTAAAAPITAASQEPAKKKKFPWWWLAIGAAGLILLTDEDQNEIKSGLNGVGKLGKKAAKKLRTIHI